MGKSEFSVMFGPDGTPAFVFPRALSTSEAKAFQEETGVWPIHTVDGELCATKPPASKKRRRP